MVVESEPLALLPLIAATLILAVRFYAREGAISIFSMSFMCATFSVFLLVVYMVLTVIGSLPPYAWVGFGGVGAVLALGGLWSFYR